MVKQERNSKGTVAGTRSEVAQVSSVLRVMFLDVFRFLPPGTVLSALCTHGCIYLMEYRQGIL